MGYSKKDRDILRELGQQIAQISAMPINEQRKELYRRINNLEKAKPTIHIYEIPWHEMDVNDELKLRTKDRARYLFIFSYDPKQLRLEGIHRSESPLFLCYVKKIGRPLHYVVERLEDSLGLRRIPLFLLLRGFRPLLLSSTAFLSAVPTCLL